MSYKFDLVIASLKSFPINKALKIHFKDFEKES